MRWKAQMFAVTDVARTYDEHGDDRDLDRVLDRFRDDPVHDPGFVRTLSRAWDPVA